MAVRPGGEASHVDALQRQASAGNWAAYVQTSAPSVVGTIVIRLLACSLLMLATVAADADPVPGEQPPGKAPIRADPVPVKRYREAKPLSELTAAAFAVRDGGFGELGLCTPRGTATVSTYKCLSLQLGHQAGAWVGGEAVEWGLRVKLLPLIAIEAGGGFSLLTFLVNAGACALAKGAAGGAGGGDMPDSRESCGLLLPMQAYPTIRAHLRLPVSRVDVVLSGTARYIFPIAGRLDVSAPEGLAIALGAGVAF